MKQKNALFVICMLIVMLLVGQVTVFASPSVTQKTIVFGGLENGERAIGMDCYNLESAKPTDDLMFLETKSARVVDTTDGKEYPLNLVSAQNGEVSYSFLAPDTPIISENLEVTTPVVYVEERLHTPVPISLNQPIGLDIEVSDSKEKFPNADRGVLVEFTAQDVEHLPYNMTLISGGNVYDNCAETYYFSIDTGDFLYGELIYFGLTIDDVSSDAVLEMASTFDKYVPAGYSIIE